jgi:hypothetical protein
VIRQARLPEAPLGMAREPCQARLAEVPAPQRGMDGCLWATKAV